MNPFTYNVTRLFDFQGRENRQPFWLWVLICYGIMTVISVVIMLPIMFVYMDALEPLMGQDQAYLDAHPEIAQQVMMKAMVPMFTGMAVFMIIIAVLYALLHLAATVRRLHDTNRSGWWCAPVFGMQFVLPFCYFGLFWQMFGAMTTLRPDTPEAEVQAVMMPMMQWFIGVWALGMLSFIFMIVLIVFCVMRGTIGPNRFGPDPLGFPDLPAFEPRFDPVPR